MILSICMSFPVTAQENEDELMNLYAQSAILMDADRGRILFGKNEDEIRSMASTTKIMTCILVLEKMKEEQIVEISNHASSQPKVRLGLRAGEKYYMKDLLYSLMLESHNDSAVALAEGIAGSVEEFAAMMNKKAEEIGCYDTHFVTPNGLDDMDENGIHSTTASDLAKIMRYCIHDSIACKLFLDITQTEQYTFNDIEKMRSFSCQNHNALLKMMDGVISGKTGFTNKAGYCYVGALKRGERSFIVVLLGCGWPNNRNYKWKDARRLLEYGLNNYKYEEIKVTGAYGELNVKDGAEKDWVKAGTKTEELSFKILKGEDEQVYKKEMVSFNIPAPVKKGKIVGNVYWFIDDTRVHSADIYTLESVSKKTMYWCLKKIFRLWVIDGQK